ncbi:MAG TPA: LacI family DNA-binding transcriptional regulator [Acidimicrobiales bacterium]|nr:LacI family DNA-binding transcriptional regulator [Acidimicrobiales bacterium]
MVTGHMVPAPAATKPGDRSPSVSIRDVARAAGVSHQTVSRVINESPNVSATTRRAVLDTITALGFRPNRAARALAGGPVQSVTVLVSNTSLYGYAAALQGIEEATREVGFGMGVRVIESVKPADVREAVERALEPAGALIVIAFDWAGVLALEQVPDDVAAVAMTPAPTEGADRGRAAISIPRQPCVFIDEFAAAKQATDYLLGLGHPTVHHLSIPSWTGTTRRIEGWRAALREAGVRAPRPLQSGWTADWGYEACRAIAKDPKVTALLCGNDDIALGAIRAMHEVGRSVPTDVSVVGFDDVPYARFCIPALTTVRQDFQTLGKVSFEVLLELLGSATRSLAGSDFPRAELVVRESAGPAPSPSATAASAPRAPRPTAAAAASAAASAPRAPRPTTAAAGAVAAAAANAAAPRRPGDEASTHKSAGAQPIRGVQVAPGNRRSKTYESSGKT